jgi:ribosomal protein S8
MTRPEKIAQLLAEIKLNYAKHNTHFSINTSKDLIVVLKALLDNGLISSYCSPISSLSSISSSLVSLNKTRKNMTDNAIVTENAIITGEDINRYLHPKLQKKKIPQVLVELKYTDGQPLFRAVRGLYKRSCKSFITVDEMCLVYGNKKHSTKQLIVSTPLGFISHHKAISAQVGGVPLLEISF